MRLPSTGGWPRLQNPRGQIIRPYGRLKLPMTIVTGYNNTSGGCVSEEPQTTGGTAQLTEQASFKYAGATAQVAAMTPYANVQNLIAVASKYGIENVPPKP